MTTLLTREEAKFLYVQGGWGEEWSDRLRNYEIEYDLAELAGVDVDDEELMYVVAEWCPFNGIFCAWREHAPREVLDDTISWWEEHRAELAAQGLRVDYHLGLLRASLDRNAAANG